MYTSIRGLDLDLYDHFHHIVFLSPQKEKFLLEWLPLLLYRNVSSRMKEKTGIIYSPSVSVSWVYDGTKMLVCRIIEVFVLGRAFMTAEGGEWVEK